MLGFCSSTLQGQSVKVYATETDSQYQISLYLGSTIAPVKFIAIDFVAEANVLTNTLIAVNKTEDRYWLSYNGEEFPIVNNSVDFPITMEAIYIKPTAIHIHYLNTEYAVTNTIQKQLHL